MLNLNYSKHPTIQPNIVLNVCKKNSLLELNSKIVRKQNQNQVPSKLPFLVFLLLLFKSFEFEKVFGIVSTEFRSKMEQKSEKINSTVIADSLLTSDYTRKTLF